MGFLKKGKEYAPAVVRWGVGIVFLIFGLDQLIRPDAWISWIPSFAYSFGVSAKNLILINGILDLVLGIFLLLGILVRLFSIIGILHLSGIIVSLGYNDVAVRDFGLLIVLISVFLHGPDKWCWGYKKKL